MYFICISLLHRHKVRKSWLWTIRSQNCLYIFNRCLVPSLFLPTASNAHHQLCKRHRVTSVCFSSIPAVLLLTQPFSTPFIGSLPLLQGPVSYWFLQDAATWLLGLWLSALALEVMVTEGFGKECLSLAVVQSCNPAQAWTLVLDGSEDLGQNIGPCSESRSWQPQRPEKPFLLYYLVWCLCNFH